MNTYATSSVSSPFFSDINHESCGWTNDIDFGSIVGGRPAIIEDHPWICSLQDAIQNHFCGANIITDRWLVTAAHCVHSSKNLNVNQLFVLCGRTEQVVSSDPNQGQIIGVQKIVIHELNEEKSDVYDIALIQLTSRVLFQPIPRRVHPVPAPICLPPPNTEFYGIARVAGWGSIKAEPAQLSNSLQEMDLQIRNQDVCTRIDPTFEPDSMICASSAGTGLDLAPGESGSALVIQTDNRHTLIGISSYNYRRHGEEPGTYPIVFTKTSFYVEWIQKTIQSD